jgi:hypothetical protein
MKKLIPIIVLLLCYSSSSLFAQQKPHKIKTASVTATQPQRAIKKTGGANNEPVPAISNSQNFPVPVKRAKPHTSAYHRSSIASVPEAVLGTTTYDLQTNGTINNRIVNNGDNTISATWTMSHGTTANGWLDRGTGYNYFDGTNWGPQPSTRIEPMRTGYQNIGYAPGGREGVLAHTLTTGFAFTSRATKGTGSWTTTTQSDATQEWSKFTAGGVDGHSFHSIWGGSPTTPFLTPLYYSRSTDDGVNWSPKAEIPQYMVGTDVVGGVGGDAYSIDARGDVVAVVVGDLGGKDLVLLKSMNNGSTWTKTIVQQFIIPMYDEATMSTDTNGDSVGDTLFTNSSDAAVVIDNNNMVHVFFGGTRLLEQPGETALGYFQTFDLYYWNESMGPNNFRLLANPPDLNGDSVISLPIGCGFNAANNPVGYYGTGITAYISMPSAGVDDNNNIYVSYQAADELSDTTLFGQDYMHIYLLKSMDGGNTWTDPDQAYDAVLASQPDGQGIDGAFAAMAKHVDSKIHLIYQRDFAPGTTLSGSTTPTCESVNNNDGSNEIVYIAIDPAAIPTGINDPAAIRSFTLSSNYPNPFHGKTSLNITLKKASDITIEVSDLLGRVLSIDKYSNFSSGSHTLSIDASKFTSGVYTYKVKVGSDVMTKKMIVQ